MIQRKQSLFLLALICLSIAQFFYPIVIVNTSGSPVEHLPLRSIFVVHTGFEITAWFIIAFILNSLNLFLALVALFSYKKRKFQLKLCYALGVMWFVLSIMVIAGSFIKVTGPVLGVMNNELGSIIGVLGIAAAFLAARLVRKDIELLKSADRIR